MDKFWHLKLKTENSIKYVKIDRDYIQKFIDLYCVEHFSVPEDITTENLKEFLEIILRYYELYFFKMISLIDLGEALTNCLQEMYAEDFPETNFPYYPKEDRRELILTILDEIESSQSILPEDVPFLIDCMNVEEEKIAETHKVITDYFDQFDRSKRFMEDIPRFELLNKQRLEAIEKGRPLPIRPMGIELDMCYKK